MFRNTAWRAIAPVAVIGLLSAPSPGGTEQQAAWRVELRRFGPVRYGMTLEEASVALHQHLRFEAMDGDCGYTHSSRMPAQTSFMVVNGRIGRVDVDSAGVETVRGAHVGSTEDEIRRLYPGQIRTQPHPYTGPEGHYLVFVPRDPADTAYAVIFETDGRRVDRFRAGKHPVVDYIEGCS